MSEDRGQALVPYVAKDGGDGKAVPAVMIQALAVWSSQYGLDPFAGQVIYYFGQPYVTERGAVANAQNSDKYQGFSISLVPPEEMKAMKLDPNADIAYKCLVHIEGFKEPVMEYGEVTQTEIGDAIKRFKDNAPFLPLVKAPGKMARARAIRRAHLLAFPLIKEGKEEKEVTKEQSVAEKSGLLLTGETFADISDALSLQAEVKAPAEPSISQLRQPIMFPRPNWADWQSFWVDMNRIGITPEKARIILGKTPPDYQQETGLSLPEIAAKLREALK